MKKNIVLAILSVCFLAAFAEETLPVVNVTTSGQYVFFSGFDFERYTPSSISLSDRVTAEANAIKNSGRTRSPFPVVGHSQGGLRSLAYATFLEKNDRDTFNNLQCVITVSGINKGLKALEGGFPGLKARAMTDINTVWNGLRATFLAVPGFNIFGLFIPDDLTGVINLFTGSMQSSGLYPKPFLRYVIPALNNAHPDTMAEIRDMMPKSNFIENNVVTAKKISYKVQTGTRTYLTWKSKKVWFFTVYYLVPEHTPVYCLYSSYHDVPQFSSQVPVGYIVGTKSNTLGMGGQQSENEARKMISTFQTVFTVAEVVHIAKCVFVFGLLSGSPLYAYDAGTARRWMENVDHELNELKGSPENDGLVAKENQYIQKYFKNPATGTITTMQPKTLGRTAEGYVEFDLNHIEIIQDKAVLQKINNMIHEASEIRN